MSLISRILGRTYGATSNAMDSLSSTYRKHQGKIFTVASLAFTALAWRTFFEARQSYKMVNYIKAGQAFGANGDSKFFLNLTKTCVKLGLTYSAVALGCFVLGPKDNNSAQ